MMRELKNLEEVYKVKITCSLESVPMGTAGPIRLAKDLILNNNPSGLLFVFNSDVICTFPLEQMLAHHKAHGGEGTIMVTPVEDPSKYGVVVSDSKDMIERFVEKPKVFISNNINAGLYLFNTSIIDRIENRPTSIEREIFPKMAAEQKIYQMQLPGYWMDIGQPKDYLLGQTLHLASLAQNSAGELSSAANVKGNVVVHPSAQIDPTAVIGPNVVVGEGCKIGAGSRVSNSTLFAGSTIGTASYIDGSIVGWKSSIANWCRVTCLTVIAEDVQVKDCTYLNGTKVLPHKGIDGSHPEEGKIIM
jgi:mannose-1-phosphate guanylyltransferase